MSLHDKAHRRSLKEYFKTLLHRRQADSDHLTPAPAFTNGNHSLILIPSLLSVSTLSDLNASHFRLDDYGDSIYQHPTESWSVVSDFNRSQVTIQPCHKSKSKLTRHEIQNAYRYQSDLAQLAKICSTDSDRIAGDSFQPTTSESDEFESYSSTRFAPRARSPCRTITPDSIYYRSPLGQIARSCNVPSIYRHGGSLQASLTTVDSSIRSSSTLPLQQSTQDLDVTRESIFSPLCAPKHTEPDALPAGTRWKMDSDWLEHNGRGRDWRSYNKLQTSSVQQQPIPVTEVDDMLNTGIDYFSSFVVLDAAVLGHPITALSDDLRNVFELGESFCNTTMIDRTTMDIVTGQDNSGNVVIHFVVYSPLVNPNSGRNRFVLVSLLDITAFITGSSSLPDLDAISQVSTTTQGEEVRTPPVNRSCEELAYSLSSEVILGASFLPDDRSKTLRSVPKDDIWLDIATEETERTQSIKSCSSAFTKSSMDDVLDQFLETLQGLYSDFFLLCRSPLLDGFHDICNVSTSVYETREFVDGYATHSSPAVKAHLEKLLTLKRSFTMRVRWGAAGQVKQLYSIPLYGRSNVTWICFLVEEGKWAGLPTWQ